MIAEEDLGASGVYALVDPRTNLVRYVGQAVRIGRRFERHLKGSASTEQHLSLAKVAWLGELQVLGLEPIVKVLAKIDPEKRNEMNEAETWFIQEYRSQGEADLNRAAGGTSFGTEYVARTKQADWAALADTLRRLRQAIEAAAEQASKIAGSDGCDRILSLRTRLDSARTHFQKKLDKTFPEWGEFTTRYFRDLPGADLANSGTPDAGTPDAESAP